MSVPTLRAENLTFGYQPGQPILRQIHLEIFPGSITMLMGSSGSGKTTLLKVLGRLLGEQQGKVYFFGKEAPYPLPPRLRNKIGYIPQQLGLVRNLSVLENVLIGSLGRNRGLASLFGFFPAHEKDLARHLLKQLGIAHKETEKVIHLSGGERQRVAIARTLMQRPSLVLADEFISDLDYTTASDILILVRKIAEEQNVTFLLSMHEAQLVKDFDGAVILMKDGRIDHHCRGADLDRHILKSC